MFPVAALIPASFRYQSSVRPWNPFDEKALGPYPKGRSLGLTLGEWLKHKGTGTYSCVDGKGTLRVTCPFDLARDHLAGLIPELRPTSSTE